MLTSWLKRRMHSREEKEFITGYDYAAGALLRGDDTPRSIYRRIDFRNFSPHDRGMIEATNKLIELNAVHDDRQPWR